MKLRAGSVRKWVFLVVVLFSLTAGLLGLSVPWGDPQGFHGEGLPIPGVIWDRASNYYQGYQPDSDHFIDFPNPYAIILNPLAFLVVCLVLWGLTELALLLVRKAREARSFGPGPSN
jgi:hypothetical protein